MGISHELSAILEERLGQFELLDRSRIFMMMRDEIGFAKARAQRRKQQLLAARDQLMSGVAELGEPSEADEVEFDVRWKLYWLAMELEPQARGEDRVELVDKRLRPRSGEVGFDLGCGSGWITIAAAKKGARVYAVDESRGQLEGLELNVDMEEIKARKTGEKLPENFRSLIEPVHHYDPFKPFPFDNCDFGTTYGVLHHLVDKRELALSLNGFSPLAPDIKFVDIQALVFQNIFRALRPGGRFTGADVGANTGLASHFDGEVRENCITGHYGKFLSPERLAYLAEQAGLKLVSTEMVDVQWKFPDATGIPFFFMGLHGDIRNPFDIINGIEKHLGEIEHVRTPEEYYAVNWPMLFFELRRPG